MPLGSEMTETAELSIKNIFSIKRVGVGDGHCYYEGAAAWRLSVLERTDYSTVLGENLLAICQSQSIALGLVGE